MSAPKKKATPIEQVPEELQIRIGKKLTRRRKELGFSNSDNFAYETGINRSQYGKYEAGKTNMTIASLIKVINLQGLTFEEFFGTGFDQK